MFDKNIAHNEMMIHIPLCTHKDPKKVLVVGKIDDHFKTEIAKHAVEVSYNDELNIDSQFDIIIYNKKTIDQLILASIDRSLNQEDGLFVCLSKSFNKDEEKIIEDLKLIGSKFWIAMPFRFGHKTAILGSKKYHPQADIILDKSDFIDGQYYNTELQNASFVYPSYIQNALTGIAKR